MLQFLNIFDLALLLDFDVVGHRTTEGEADVVADFVKALILPDILKGEKNKISENPYLNYSENNLMKSLWDFMNPIILSEGWVAICRRAICRLAICRKKKVGK